MAIKFYFDGLIHNSDFSEEDLQEKKHLTKANSLIYFFDDLDESSEMEIWKYNTITKTLTRFNQPNLHNEQSAQWFAPEFPAAILFFGELRSL